SIGVVESRLRSSQFRDRRSDNQFQRKSFKEAVNQGGNIGISLPNIAGKSIENLMGWSDQRHVNNFEISIKLILGFGPNGSWEVKWAGLADTQDGPHHAQPKPAKGKAQPKTAPRQNQVWRPRAGPQIDLKPNPTSNPTPSIKPDSTPIFQWNPTSSPGASTSYTNPEASHPRNEAPIDPGVLALPSTHFGEIDEITLMLPDLDRT
ncbi:hypothetical protein FCV25MIE_29914, partial [Fagus crenata]